MPNSTVDTDLRETIHSDLNKRQKWNSRDTGWMMNLFGTAIGAGILYLPINAGAGGIWSLVVLALLAGPMVWLAHRNLVRFCLSSSNSSANITGIVNEHFGTKFGKMLTFAYFLSIYPILLLYSIGITNVVISFIENQLQIEAPSRLLLSLGLVCFLVAVMHIGESWMLVAIKLFCFSLVVILIGISFYLIPEWNMAVFEQPFDGHDMLITLFLTTPLLVFSFNHSPACSAFARAYRLTLPNQEACAKKTSLILKRNTQLLLVIILLFVFSCVLSLTTEDLILARDTNLPVLSILANRSGNPVFSVIAPAIAFLAIASSFFGVYLGSLEGMQGLVAQQWLKYYRHRPLNIVALKRCTIAFSLITCWLAGYANWSVISMVEVIVVPILATILYLMPVYAFYKVKSLKHFRNFYLDTFTVTIGIIAITAFIVDQVF